MYRKKKQNKKSEMPKNRKMCTEKSRQTYTHSLEETHNFSSYMCVQAAMKNKITKRNKKMNKKKQLSELIVTAHTKKPRKNIELPERYNIQHTKK